MHELALTQGLVDTVIERTGGQSVTAVRIRVGQLSGVLPEAMQFCFEIVTDDTPLRGAALEIEQTPGRATCRSCGLAFILPDPILLCPCGSADVQVTGGRELLLTSVQLIRQEAK